MPFIAEDAEKRRALTTDHTDLHGSEKKGLEGWKPEVL